jgi:AcrR family transcriptional regulator
MTERKVRKTDRAEILGAARALVLAQGASALTMRRLGDALGVSAPAVYRHYRDKDELLSGLVDEGNALLEGYLREATRGRTPSTRLAKTAAQYARFAVEQPAFYGILFLSADRPKMDVLPAERTSRNFDFLVARVCDAVREGVLRRADPVLIAISLWAHWHGLVAMFRAGRFGAGAGGFLRVFRKSTGLVLRAMAPGRPEETANPAGGTR